MEVFVDNDTFNYEAYLPPISIIHIHHMKHITSAESYAHLLAGYQWILEWVIVKECS